MNNFLKNKLTASTGLLSKDVGGIEMRKHMRRPQLKDKLMMLAFLTLGMMVLATGCTKKRDAGLSAADSTNSFAISDLVGPTYQIGTGTADETPEVAAPQTVKNANQKPSTKIKSANVPSRLEGLFANRKMFGKQSSSYQIVMSLNGSSLMVSKLVASKAELNTVELGLAQKSKKGIVAPVFMIPITKMGVLEREKNDLGEETSKLKFVDTDPSSATHIQLDLRQTSLKDPYTSKTNEKILKEIFTADSLNGKVLNHSALKSAVDYSVTLAKPLEKVLVKTQSASNGVDGTLLVYEITKKSKLDSDEKNNINKSKKLLACEKEVLEQLSKEEQDDCVLKLDHEVPYTTGDLKLVQAENGDITNAFEFEPGKSSTGLIRVVSKVPAIRAQNTIEGAIRISDIKGKEFFFRRTYEDSASSIQYFGPGASGNMSVVTMELEPSRVVIKKVLMVNGDQKPGSIDKEELMSLPATYARQAVNSNDLVQTSLSDAEYVVLNWTNNKLGVVNSPLSFLEDGSCFQETGNQTMVNPDIRLKDGVMSFSIEGTYTFKPMCMSYYKLDQYWWANQEQGNFNIRERLSFRVNTKELDNKIDFDIPFRAQNLLNFGVFTMGALEQDHAGNIGNNGTQKSLPVVQDFSNGKVMTYILGGLPDDDQELRKVMIDTTQKVVDDWNVSLARAFKGTALARTGPYILLQIDGVAGTPVGKLGDLDKNYIWNFHKNIDSGLLGMSQAAPNPRSGKIEQNNVLMYSGNLKAYIGSQKEAWIRQNELNQLRAKILAEAKKVAPPAPVKGEEKPAPASSKTNPATAKLLFNAMPKASNPRITPAAMKTSLNQMANLKGSPNLAVQAKVLETEHGSRAVLKRIMDLAIKNKLQKDTIGLQALIATELARTDSQVLANFFAMSEQEQTAMRAVSQKLAIKASIDKNMKYNRDGSLKPNCSLDADMVTSFPKNDMSRPINEIFSEWYSTTLSHEIGHSLGLTHNFQGSLDGDNFKFPEETESVRNYSSIMDYTPDIYAHYAGPGPYDVFALRAAYTGMVELDDGNFMSLAEIKAKTVGSRSWWDLDVQSVSKIGVKYHEYCTDINVGSDPTCNRFDQGTSAGEIARFYAKEYKDNYILLNSLGDKIEGRSFSAYLSRVISSMFAMRQFVDETFYLASLGGDYSSALDGAISSWSTLVNIVTAPDAEGAEGNIYKQVTDEAGNVKKVLNPDRYAVQFIEYPEVDMKTGQPTGKKIEEKVLIEKKAIKNINKSGFSWITETRGVEIDKAFASMLLAQRGLGHPRYEQVGLSVSVTTLEAVFGMPVLGRPTLMTLRGMMEGRIPNLLMLANGMEDFAKGKRMTSMDPTQFVANSTQMLEFYGALSSTVLADMQLPEATHNYAAAFRVGSSKSKPPKDRVMVTAKDESPTSEMSQKYYAFDNGTISSDMVKSAAGMRVYFENVAAITNPLVEIINARATEKPEEEKAARAKMAKAIADLNKDDVLLSKEQIASGVTYDVLVDIVVEYTEANFQKAAEITQQLEAAKADIPDEVEDQVLPRLAAIYGQAQDRENDMLGRAFPVLALAEKIIDSNVKDSPLGLAASAFIKTERLEERYNQSIKSLNLLNSLVVAIHPNLAGS